MIELHNISRIVGHADLEVDIGKEGVKAKFKILNDPRFIEAIVVGKKFHEVPRIVSRICGPCGLSHALTSAMTIENILGIEVSQVVKLLREIAILGEVAENHLLHLSLVALPDYFSCKDIFELAKTKPKLLKQVLSLRSNISKVVEAIAGRLIHPNASIIGGFTRLPSKEKLEKLRDILNESLTPLADLVDMFMTYSFPELEVANDLCVCILEDYSFIGDKVILSNGKCFPASSYQQVLLEEVAPYTTSKQVTAEGLPIYTGARARINLRADSLSEQAKHYIKMRDVPFKNPFDNVRAQAVELIHCVYDMLTKIEDVIYLLSLGGSRRPSIKITEGEGVGVSEAPRGLLIHHYKLNGEGVVTYANIITPTAINSRHIEVAASELVRTYFYEDLPLTELKRYLEKLVQAYDPCLGCAPHTIRISIKEV